MAAGVEDRLERIERDAHRRHGEIMGQLKSMNGTVRSNTERIVKLETREESLRASIDRFERIVREAGKMAGEVGQREMLRIGGISGGSAAGGLGLLYVLWYLMTGGPPG